MHPRGHELVHIRSMNWVQSTFITCHAFLFFARTSLDILGHMTTFCPLGSSVYPHRMSLSILYSLFSVVFLSPSVCDVMFCECSPEVTVTSLRPPRLCRLAVFLTIFNKTHPSLGPRFLLFPVRINTIIIPVRNKHNRNLGGPVPFAASNTLDLLILRRTQKTPDHPS